MLYSKCTYIYIRDFRGRYNMYLILIYYYIIKDILFIYCKVLKFNHELLPICSRSRRQYRVPRGNFSLKKKDAFVCLNKKKKENSLTRTSSDVVTDL